jgi:peptidyl-prolyl cis-trans isomerase SurA
MLAALCGAPAMAQNAQGIAVLVNDEPISNYDVQQRVRLITVTTGQRDTNRLRSRAIDELVEEKLIMQEAKRLNINVPQEGVQQQLKDIAQRTKMTVPQFTRALSGVGINISSFSKRIETQLVWPLVIRARFGRNLQARPEDVDEALRHIEGPKISTRYEFILQGILFIVPKDASEATVNARVNLAKHLQRGFRSCAETKAQVAGVPDVVINDLGQHTSDAMSPAERKTFDELGVNQTTAPRIHDTGVELIAVCAKNEIKDEKLARRTAEIELINKEFEAMSRRHLLDLKRDAVIERR